MRLSEIVDTSAELRRTRSRKQKAARLAACLRRLEPGEIEPGVAYLYGTLRQGKLGIGWAALREARETAAAAVPALELREVDRELGELGRMSGAGSARERARRLGRLFGLATPAEQEFLVRLLLGELRQGASEGLMIEAIAQATGAGPAEVRRAVMLSGSVIEVARAGLAEGPQALGRFSIQVFRPILPMLAQPAEDLGGVLERMGEAAFEFKLDGARIQLHKSGAEVRVFTRKLNEVTEAVPEVVEAARALPARELILDGEAIALDAGGAPLPFQATMRRFGRKLDVAALREALPLSWFHFDCLYLDGEGLVDRRGADRAAALESVVPADERVPRLVTPALEEVQAFWREALDRGHEGLMAKSLEAIYEAGGRRQSWLKLKPAHTLDLVVLAAEWGSGRRRGWLSNLHLGARDPSTGGFVMLGKTFKGLTDKLLAWQTEKLLALATARDGHVVHVKPELVVEIAFNGVQSSPHYPGGIALRFARVKGYRSDKGPADADTIAAVRAIHAAAQPGAVRFKRSGPERTDADRSWAARR